jgi:hypothetical protein
MLSLVLMLLLGAAVVSACDTINTQNLNTQTPDTCLDAIAPADSTSVLLESCAAHPAMPATMPPLVDAMIHMRWAELDTEGNRLMETLRAFEPLHSFAHARGACGQL